MIHFPPLTRLAAPALGALLLATAAGTGAQDASPHAADGLTVTVIAHIPHARELAATPNGDLIVGTESSDVMIVPHADGDAGQPHRFVHVDDSPAAGVTLDGKTLYIGSQFGVWRLPYTTGEQTASAAPVRIAKVRTSGQSRDHVTTSVTVAKDKLYASVGSSCDACDPELDATRATVQEMNLDGSDMHPKAERIRNAVALTTNPNTGNVWAIPNGQDALAHGHPYEIGDAITLHDGVPDYGWPHCYEDRKPVEASAKCDDVTVPRIAMPAYNAPIGALIAPAKLTGKYALPARYAGGLFVALHGSWHSPPVPPRVVFIPLNGDTPKTAVNWNDPNTQWQSVLDGFQHADGSRTGRPTGLALGPDGSLFVADDASGVIYRVRPAR